MTMPTCTSFVLTTVLLNTSARPREYHIGKSCGTLDVNVRPTYDQ